VIRSLVLQSYSSLVQRCPRASEAPLISGVLVPLIRILRRKPHQAGDVFISGRGGMELFAKKMQGGGKEMRR